MPVQTVPTIPQSSGRVTRSQDASARLKLAIQPRPRLHRYSTAGNAPLNMPSGDEHDNADIEEPQSSSRDPTYPHKSEAQSSTPMPTRRRVASDNAAQALSPFGDSHNRRLSGVRRPRPSSSEQSRKRRSLEKPEEPTPGATSSQRAKPRLSVPSRIPAPVKSALASQTTTVMTPERPARDVDNLLRSNQASLKKLSLGEAASNADCDARSESFSPPEMSPSARKGLRMMNPPHARAESSDLLEYFFDTPLDPPKLLALATEFHHDQPKTRGFERQVSQAHVLFGGPAILSPATNEVPPPSSQPAACDDDDDDDFFKFSSPSKPPFDEPGLVKKFKPRDSGVVVSDGSEPDSPVKSRSAVRDLPHLRLPVSGPGVDGITPTSRALRRSAKWGPEHVLADSVTDQPALKVLFDHAPGKNEAEPKARPRTPTKRIQSGRMFSSVPRPKASVAPSAISKGRKSMPNSRFDLAGVIRSPSPEKKPITTARSPMKQRPTILTDFLKRCDQPGLTSASSSVDSISEASSFEETPTRYRAANLLSAIQGAGNAEPRRPTAPRRSSSRFHIITARVSQEDEEGRFANQFQVLGELGHGQFGQVLRVHDRLRNAEYAVKKSERYTGPRHRMRLREEVDALKTLTERGGHPNVLRYIDSWDEEDHLHIQTELCQMGNLSTFLNEYGKKFDKLDEGYIWKIVADVGDGLQFIHFNGFIHLDLKPANILVSDEGRLLIGDFGMASAWPRQMTGDFEREGDREYMAPEILRGVYGKAADMFSFGMVILEAAANIVVPDMGTPWQRLRQEDFDDAHFEGLSARLVQLIRGMMRTEPGKRLMVDQVCRDVIVGRARAWMNTKRAEAAREGRPAILGSPLAEERAGFVKHILGVDGKGQ